VSADEPALLDRAVPGLHFGPERRRVVLAVLVDRDGVIGVVDDLRQARVVELVVLTERRELEPGERHAETSYRVPHADETHARQRAVGIAERLGFR